MPTTTTVGPTRAERSIARHDVGQPGRAQPGDLRRIAGVEVVGGPQHGGHDTVAATIQTSRKATQANQSLPLVPMLLGRAGGAPVGRRRRRLSSAVGAPAAAGAAVVAGGS